MKDKIDNLEEWLGAHPAVKSGGQFADGCVIGKWRIAAFVAKGGSGEVYRVLNIESGHAGALKILSKLTGNNQARFELESQVLATGDSPYFPKFFDSGEYVGHPYCVTEFLDPVELPSKDADVAKFVLAVARGVARLHAIGYIHRDIKPSNIMMRNGSPVLIDLGLLKKTDAEILPLQETLSVQDGRRVGVGTPGFSAPEQFTGGGVSPAADIHALGVLVSTCFGEHQPRAWRKIILKATSSLPAERYQSVGEFIRAVRFRHLPATCTGAVSAAALAVATMLTHPADSSRQFPGFSPVLKTKASSSQEIQAQLPNPLGEALDVPQFYWTSAPEPWKVTTEHTFDGISSVESTLGGDGGISESWMKATVEFEKPQRMVFYFQKSYYHAIFSVTVDDFVRFSDNSVASYEDVHWYRGVVKIPAGTHEVKFSYHHPGVGWKNQFNGVRIDRVMFFEDKNPENQRSAVATAL